MLAASGIRHCLARHQMTEREQLERTVAHLETQRKVIGEDAVDSALAVLRERLASLEGSKDPAGAESEDVATRRALHSPLIGRAAELTVLQRRVQQLQAGKGGVVWVLGEAGVGKSRLIAEVRERVVGTDVGSIQWLEGSALSPGTVTTHWPFREILWRYAGITEQDNEGDVWRKLRNRLATLFDEKTDEVLPYLATLISLDVEQDFIEQVRYLSGDAMRRQLFRCSRRLFEEIARTRPLALVFEDLQWIDESSSLLLQHLLPLIYRAPILMISLTRPTVGTPQARLREVLATEYHDRYDEIILNRLSPSNCAKLVARLLDHENPPPALTDMIIDRAEGNPLFVQEIIRVLIADGLLRRETSSDEWHLTTGIDDAQVPRTIQGSILARVDLLDSGHRAVLNVAAVIGRSFLYRVLNVAVQVNTELEIQLATLQNMGLILEDSSSPESAYVFCHDLTHEAIYEGIEMSERKRLHARVGTAIESLFVGRLDEFYSLLAYHYSRAEDWKKAQEYLFRAGDQAGFVAADSEALVHYERAVQAYARAFGTEWSPLERACLERKIGTALFRQGEYHRAVERLDEGLTCLSKPAPKSPRWTRMYLFRELARQILSRSWVHRFPINEMIPLEVEEEFRIHEALFWIHSSTDVERFLFHTIALLNLSERHGFGLGMALGYSAAGVSCDFLSLFRLAGHYHRLGLDAAERVRHPLAAAYGYMGNALHSNTLADWDRAVEFCDKGAESFTSVGDLKSWAYVTHLRCCALAYRGDYAQALSSSRHMFETADDLGDAEAAGRARWNEGYVLSRVGLLDEASRSLNEAMTLGQSAGNPISGVIACHELALIDLHQHRIESALARVAELERMLSEYRVTQYLCVPSHNAATEAYLVKAEESSGAGKALWLQRAGSACGRGLKQSKACSLVKPEAMRLKGVYEWLSGKPRTATRWWKRGLTIAEKTAQRYDQAMLLREIGQRLGDRECLDRAERICAELGAK